MFSALIDALVNATSLPRDVLERILTRTKDLSLGDYALPCFPLAKEWKIAPPEAALKLKGQLTLPSGLERCEAVGPYLNFFLNKQALARETVSAVLSQGTKFGAGKHSDKTIVLDYSGPNIAKPFHVGHLRTTLIGLALDRIYRHLGYKVVSVNHLGDWGTQFGFVYAGWKVWGTPDHATMDDLLELYRRASGLRKAQDEKRIAPEDADKPEINSIARDYFSRLESGDEEATKFWRWCLDISMEYYLATYKRLGIEFDFYTGESFYRDQLEGIESRLRESGVLADSEGALGVELGKPLGFVRIFAEDGRSLYITRDLATADYRERTFHPWKILYVVGAPQQLHFKQLIAVLKQINHPVAEKMVHVSYGNVPGISTRNSKPGDDRFSLRALMDEAHERALTAYRTQVEKRPEGLDEEKVAEAVGLGAVFFNYLCRSNIKEFHFTWEEALNFQGDTGPYIQYALARLNSIEAKAREEGLMITPSSKIDYSLLAEPGTHELVSLLSQFPERLERSAADYEPHHVALYALDLARAFSANYRSLRVLGADRPVAEARLALFSAIKFVLYTGLTLIGVPPVDRM